MKIKLEEPYSSIWKLGYLVESQGRKNLLLVNNRKDRTTTSYARYLMSVHLGRMLNSNEHVDHINEDKADDRLENLQILTISENNKKHAALKKKKYALIQCPFCGKSFECRVGQCQVSPSKNGMIKCCSRDCANKLKKISLTKNERNLISKSSIISIFEK